MRRLAIAIVIISVIALAIGILRHSRTNVEQNPGEQHLIQPERGNVRLTVTADGVLQPLTTVAVKSYAGGRLDLLTVDIGDEVDRGDLIASIDPTETLAGYNQAMADLSAAQARLRQAREQSQVQPALTRAAIAQADASYRSAVTELQRLHESTHPQARAQARSALDKARSNQETTERELVRTRNLVEQGFLPPSELDAAENRREIAVADLANAQERWDRLESELKAELEAAEARVAQARAALERARAEAVQDSLREADVVSAEAQVARVEAQVESARTMLDYTTIRAPRKGVVLDRFVEEGTIVTGGRTAVTQGTDIILLGDVSRMFAEVSLDEADVNRTQVDQRVAVSVDAFPDRRFQGRVTRINPQAVTQQNITTVLVTVEIENPDARLKPGMTAMCEFVVEEVRDVLTLPNRALWADEGQPMVTLKRGEELTPTPVKVGLVGNERVEILEGLTEEDLVVMPSLTVGAPTSGADWMRERGRRAAGGGAFFGGPGR